MGCALLRLEKKKNFIESIVSNCRKLMYRRKSCCILAVGEARLVDLFYAWWGLSVRRITGSAGVVEDGCPWAPSRGGDGGLGGVSMWWRMDDGRRSESERARA
jgi:hypothetical protein